MTFNKINTHILILVIIGFVTSIEQCYNNGKPILTRTIQRPYSLYYQCLCPFDYYGTVCNEHRLVYCLFTNTTIKSYTPETSPNANLAFTMQCYLKGTQQPYNQSSPIQKPEFKSLPLTEEDVQRERQQDNYYIDKRYKIIWANDSDLFDQDGQVIIPQNSTQTQQSILNSYSPYQFTYRSQFYGYPLTNAIFSYNFEAKKYMNGTVGLQNIKVSLQKQNVTKNIKGSTSLNIDEGWLEYGVAKLQMILVQYYGQQQRVSHQVGMNSARWRVYDQMNQPIDEPIFYGGTLSISLWMILATIVVFLLVGGSRIIIRIYKKYLKDKNRKALLREDLEQQN